MTELKESIIGKANIIVEALPYISRYSGKTIVIKYGGNAMNNEGIIHTILQDVATLKMVGVKPVVVHGGGPEINAMLNRLAIESKFINGLRVTSEATMEVVQMVLAGKVNKNLVSELNTMGVSAIGLCGKDGKLIEVEKKSGGIDYGFVGEIKKINADILTTLLNGGFIPVIATVGTDERGVSYNINADIVAGAIGGALKAEKVIFLTDIDGIRRDEKDADSLIEEITTSEIASMIKSGAISGGMIPKVNSCVYAVEKGVKQVLITNGTVPHSILLELFTDRGFGSLIKL